ncbi:MAG: hypothetical protein NKF70_10205 [Methanobacterium sp. ERen5]|nr:MAG: hypothetical protein NKF70_10205 [Methanobacterium sp. ERen5]
MDIKRFLWELSGFDLIFGPLRCPNCDSKLKRSDCFCPECGHKLPWNENKNKKKVEIR